MKNLYIWIVAFAAFFVSQSAESAEINERISVSVTSSGDLTVETSYLTNYIMRARNPQSNELGPIVLINRSTEALEYSSVINANWDGDGFFPEDVDFQLPRFSTEETQIDLSEYSFPGDETWENTDVVLRGGSLAGLVTDTPQTSDEITDSIVLVLLNGLALTEIASEAVIQGDRIDTLTAFEKLRPLATFIQNYRTHLETADDIFVFVEIFSEQGVNFAEAAGVDLADYPEVEGGLAYFSSFISAVNDLEITIRPADATRESRKGSIAQQYNKLLDGDVNDSIDTIFEKVGDKFAEEFEASTSREEEIEVFLKYAIEPFGDVMEQYQASLQRDLKNLKQRSPTSTTQIEALENKIYVSRNLFRFSQLAKLFLTGEDFAAVLRDDPELLVSTLFDVAYAAGEELITVDNIEIAAKSALQKITNTDGRGVRYGAIRKASDKANGVMAGLQLGSAIGNKMIPFLWDFTLGENYLQTSIVDGKVSTFGFPTTIIDVRRNGSLLHNFSNSDGVLVNTILAEPGDILTFDVSLFRPKLFEDDRAPWMLNFSQAPQTIYSIGINSSGQYKEKVLCVRKILGNLDFSVQNIELNNFDAFVADCGEGTLRGGDAFADVLNSRALFNDPDLLPEFYKVSAAAGDISTYIETLDYMVGGRETEVVTVSYRGLDLNSFTHRIQILPATGTVDFNVDYAALTETDLTIAAELPSAFTENNSQVSDVTWDWGDGLQDTTTALAPLSHTYSERGLYTVTVTVNLVNGQVFTQEMIINVLNPDPILPAPEDLSAVSVEDQVVVEWSPVDGAQSYNLYYAIESFGASPDLDNYASLNGGTLLLNISSTTQTIAGLSDGQTYYFIVTAVDASQRGLPSEEFVFFNGNLFEVPAISDNNSYEFGELERASVNSAGEVANSTSRFPSLSSDGRFTLFSSKASNLAEQDNEPNVFPGSPYHVFLRDDLNGTTELISKDLDGNPVEATNSSMSLSGRYVVYKSPSNEILESNESDASEVFIYDRETTAVENIKLLPNVLFYESVTISGSGRYLVLSANVSGGDNVIHVLDRQNNTFRVLETGAMVGSTVSVSADGQYIAFEGINEQVFLYSVSDETITLVSKNSDGVAGNEPSSSPSISANGTHIIFSTQASNLSPDDPNFLDLYRYNISTDTIELISDWESAGVDYSLPSISSNGRHLSFIATSNSTHFVFSFDTMVDEEPVLVSGTDPETPLARVDFNFTPMISADGQAISFVYDSEILVSRRSEDVQQLGVVIDEKFDGVEIDQENWLVARQTGVGGVRLHIK